MENSQYNIGPPNEKSIFTSVSMGSLNSQGESQTLKESVMESETNVEQFKRERSTVLPAIGKNESTKDLLTQ